MKMTILRALTAIAALAMTLTATAADKVVLSTMPTTVAAPPAVGMTKGYFTKQGIDLVPRWTHRGRDTVQLLVTGQADLGIGSIAPALVARSRGLPLVVIGLHSHGFPGYFVAANKDAKLTTLWDFKGKRIGTPVGSGVYTIMLMAMEKEGLKPSDFKIENVRPPDMPAAMATTGFDAMMGWIPYVTRIVAMGDGKVVMRPAQFEKLTGVTYPMVLMTTEKEIKEKPQVLQRFMNAWAESERFVYLHHEATLKILRKTLGYRVKALDDKTLMKILYGYHHDRIVMNQADISGSRRMAEFLYAHKHIKRTPDMDKAIDQRFAKRAAAKYH